MKITTKSGFKCDVNKDIMNDWRFIRSLGKCQNPDTALEGAIELETALLGKQGAIDLENHLEALDGLVKADRLFEELTEIMSNIDKSKN